MIPHSKKDHKFVITDKTGRSCEIKHCHFNHSVFFENYSVYEAEVKKFYEKFEKFVELYDDFKALSNFAARHKFVNSDEAAKVKDCFESVFEFRYNIIPSNQLHLTRLRKATCLLLKAIDTVYSTKSILRRYTNVTLEEIESFKVYESRCYPFVGEALKVQSYNHEIFGEYFKGVHKSANNIFEKVKRRQSWSDRDLQILSRLFLEYLPEFYTRQIMSHMSKILITEVEAINKKHKFNN